MARLRLLPHACLLVALLSLSGCGGGGDNGTPSPTSNPPPTTNPPPATPRAGTAPAAQPGQYMVFQGGTNSLYKYDLDTGSVIRLWEAPDENMTVYALRISPDGQTISFGFSNFPAHGNTPGNVLMGSDGSGSRSLTDASGEWSPDDSKVAYISQVQFTQADQSEASYPEVWIVDRDGNNRRKLSEPVLDVTEADDIIELKWSPDGRYVSWVLIDDPVLPIQRT